MKLKLLSAALALSGALSFSSHAEDAAGVFKSKVFPVLKENCVKCHGNEKQKSKINFEEPRTLEKLSSDKELWFHVLDQVDSGTMPPEEGKKLSDADKKTVVAWITGEYTSLQAANQKKDGRARLRRLTREEYANTVEDIFGVRPNVELELPSDGRVDGYEKVSAALPMTADGSIGYMKMAENLFEKYLFKHAPRVYDKPPENSTPEFLRTIHAEARPSEQSKGHLLELPDGWVVSFNSDVNSGPIKYPGVKTPGMHKIRVNCYGYQTDKPLPFGIYVGTTWSYPQQIHFVKLLEAPPGKAAVVETEVFLKQGWGMRVIPFGLGVPVPKNSQASQCKGPGLAIQWVEDVQPEYPLRGETWLTADMSKQLAEEIRNSNNGRVVLKKSKTTNRDEFLTILAKTFKRAGTQLYRRELTQAELSAIMTNVTSQIDGGTPFENVIADQIIDMMTSPEFFCVIEQPGQLNDYALASRLAYFLWNSTPDETLLNLAAQGKLRDPKVLAEQTDRLLNDPKSERFANDFLDQWLGMYAINDTSPDSKLYPEYGRNELLKHSSVWQTQQFFGTMLKDNLSVKSIVDSKWTYMNDILAQHYGVPGVVGSTMKKVDWPGNSPFGGLWTDAVVMKVTANGTNTSPVKRGVWVARRLLGVHIPPPPPNINPVDPDIRGAKTLREQLAQHSASATCAACHAKFDPYGFALESFDVTGAFRTKYREVDAALAALPPDQRKGKPAWKDGLPVDCSGKTPEGAPFSSIVDLKKMLIKNPVPLASGVAKHLVTYATGSAPTGVDNAAIDGIVKAAAKDDYGLRSLIHAVVQSELFRWK